MWKLDRAGFETLLDKLAEMANSDSPRSKKNRQSPVNAHRGLSVLFFSVKHQM